jgi:hypothetical protein
MTIFDLVFLVAVLASVVTLSAAGVLALRGRFRQAAKLLARYGAGVALYLAVLVAVSLVSPQRVLAVGEDHCFDDWCIAVQDVAKAPQIGDGEGAVKAEGVFYVVTLRLSNRARGRPQRASSAGVFLLDGQGRRYGVSLRGQEAFESRGGGTVPLTATIPVGGSLRSVQVFDLPSDARDVALTVKQPLGPSPGLLVIGDGGSLFHKPTIVRVP